MPISERNNNLATRQDSLNSSLLHDGAVQRVYSSFITSAVSTFIDENAIIDDPFGEVNSTDYDECDEYDDLDEEAVSDQMSDFPNYEIPSWDSEDEREYVVDLYMRQIEYRLRWIFYREEREGFRRRGHGVRPFSHSDLKDKIDKKITHELDTPSSVFYDWDIGATDFILRFEGFTFGNLRKIRIHFIYKVNGKEIGYQDRVWNGDSYDAVFHGWASVK